MGIDRRMVGDFFNGANRARVAERCQRMNDLFERPCVILESDRPSEDGVVPRSVHVPGGKICFVEGRVDTLSHIQFRFGFITGSCKKECFKVQFTAH